MAWAFLIPPGRDELLSGYLSRVAFAHGASPHAFYQLHLQDGWFWTRDIDRGVARRHHEAILRDAKINASSLQTMTLQPWINVLTPSKYSQRIAPAVTPWINAVGIRQEGRRLHALQYCPECLNASGVVKRQWRLSFYTHCAQHNSPLMDACERCDAPFIPHRSLGSILRCSHCQSTLQMTRLNPLQAQETSQALQMQNDLAVTLDSAANGTLSAKADLYALRTLASTLLANQERAKVAGDILGCPSMNIDHWTRLEFARIDQRLTMLACLRALLDGWPDTLRALAAKLNITQRTFSRYPVDAEWLKHEVERLPTGWTRMQKKRKRPLETRVRELEQSRPTNWRAKRAALFVRAAKRS